MRVAFETDKLCVWTPEWEEARKYRSQLLNLVSVQQYHGFVGFELRELRGLPVDANPGKPAYHAFRLSAEIDRILRGESPKVFLEGADRDELMRIRSTSTPEDKDRLIEEISTKRNRVKRVLEGEEASTISKQGDFTPYSQWAVSLRLQQYRNAASPIAGISPARLPSEPSESSTMPWINEHLKLARQALSEHELNDAVILFCAQSGSGTYGLTRPTDQLDWTDDVVVVYAAPAAQVLDPICPPLSTIASRKDQQDTPGSVIRWRRGLVLYEIEHAVTSLMRGDHVIVESLFTEVKWESDCWREFIYAQLRAGTAAETYLFTKGLVMQYFGLAEKLLFNVKEDPNVVLSDTYVKTLRKNLYLATRLVMQVRSWLFAAIAVCLAFVDDATHLLVGHFGTTSRWRFFCLFFLA
jgi:hypothetical protein